MNPRQDKMLEKLIELKSNFNVIGVKISYEDEGLTSELAQMMSSLVFKSGLALSMKVGGCEAKRDIYDSKVLGCDKIVGPMIETPYALKKYIQATKTIFSQEEWQNTKFMVNIETITGFNNLREMMELPESNDLYGVVLGRVDFAGSLSKDRSWVNSSEMSEYAMKMANILAEYDKKLYIGGGVNLASLDFFEKLPPATFISFETRNIIFDAKGALANPKIEEGLTKAMGFELEWLKFKKDFYGRLSNLEVNRIKMIQERYEASCEKLGI